MSSKLLESWGHQARKGFILAHIGDAQIVAEFKLHAAMVSFLCKVMGINPPDYAT